MPVWHELSRAWRERHDLAVVGIAQEQHGERCALWARWQGIDWPILWDPFNLTEARAVPNVYALDEAGIVRAIRPDPSTFEAAFLERDFGVGEAAQLTARSLPRLPAPRLPELADAGLDDGAVGRWSSLSDVLFGPAGDLTPAAALDLAIERFGAHVAETPADATARFRLGVAHRLRHDSDGRRPGDLQAALDAWSEALAARPGEYIWRRRIQQYGPTLDKPYPFYPWMEQAVADLRDRGQDLPDLSSRLTEAERARPRREFAVVAGDDVEPDPTGDVPRDDGSWLELETAVAPPTDGRTETVRVHLALRPRTEEGVHWNDEAGDLLVWLEAPDGWTLERRLLRVPADPARPVSQEPRSVDVELRRSPLRSGVLTGYVLFGACEDANGVCTFLRRDLTIAVGD